MIYTIEELKRNEDELTMLRKALVELFADMQDEEEEGKA